MIRFVVDMNLSPEWAVCLTQAGWPSTHWIEIGEPDAPDHQIVQWAKDHHYCIFTHDLDFSTILSVSNDTTPSVIQLRCENTNPSAMLDQVTKSIRCCQKDIAAGCLLTIDPKRSRIRILPLTRHGR